MIEAFSRAHAFASAATPVILYGESGTGKTFFAEYIHQASQRPDGFHAFSVGTVAPQLAADDRFEPPWRKPRAEAGCRALLAAPVGSPRPERAGLVSGRAAS